MKKIKLTEKEKYVIAKAKTAAEMYYMVNNQPYRFEMSEVLDSRTFEMWVNLKPIYSPLYEILILMFFKEHKVVNDAEKLVWASEVLDQINNNHQLWIESNPLLKLKK